MSPRHFQLISKSFPELLWIMIRFRSKLHRNGFSIRISISTALMRAQLPMKNYAFFSEGARIGLKLTEFRLKFSHIFANLLILSLVQLIYSLRARSFRYDVLLYPVRTRSYVCRNTVSHCRIISLTPPFVKLGRQRYEADFPTSPCAWFSLLKSSYAPDAAAHADCHRWPERTGGNALGASVHMWRQ